MQAKLIVILAVFVLSACSVTRETPAPVINVTAPPVAPTITRTPPPAVATAKASTPSGTTVSKINSADDDNIELDDGQTQPLDAAATTQPPRTTPAPVKTPPAAAVAAGSAVTIGGQAWLRPLNGKIIQTYTPALKGVDVAAKEGTPIVAAANGKVAYSGNGLKGYGNLIIIKHSNNYLTAYSHNKVNLVKDGEVVKRGQKIAEVGKTESERPLLHFELRKNGKPLDPSALFQ